MRISDWRSDVCSSDLGGQDEMVRVVRMLASDVQSGKISADAIGMADIEVRLDTRDIPHPDLVIRTSGEVRLSNFLLWQAAYSELLFVDTLWPDFAGPAIAQAVDAYAGRDRLYGALGSRPPDPPTSTTRRDSWREGGCQ